MDANVDLNTIKTFFDPHPGFAGAIIPLPTAVKRIADGLRGKKISLREALAEIQSTTNGVVSIKNGWIALKLSDSSNRTHMFRVIRFC